MRYTCDNTHIVQHEEQYYNSSHRRMAMALSTFEMSELFQPQQLHEAEPVFILHTHTATQENFSSINGQNIFSFIPNSLLLDSGLSGNKPFNIPIFHILKTDSYFFNKP